MTPDSSIQDWVMEDFRLAWGSQSWQKIVPQRGMAKRLSCSLVGSSQASLQLGLHEPMLLPLCPEICLRRAGLVWQGGQRDTCLGKKSTEEVEPGELVRPCWPQCQVGCFALRNCGFLRLAEMWPLHPWWTQPAPPAEGTGKADSHCGLLSTKNRLKLFFFRAVLRGAGRGHPDRALRINFTSVSPCDKMFEVSQFLYVLSRWLRTALSWIGEGERCKSSSICHLPVFWLREREINKSCQKNALEWPFLIGDTVSWKHP